MNNADLNLLAQTVRQAGAIAVKYFNDGSAKVWEKEHNHPVTDADIAVNDYLQMQLMAARPDYGWLSEETKDDFSHYQKPRSFIIDPIDGTRAFMDGQPNFTIVAAVIEEGHPVVGVVYNPLKDEMYTAIRGGGASMNGKAISVHECTAIKNCTMVGYPRKFRRLGWPQMNVSIINSMAYRIVLVASGQRDATVSFTPKSDWDLAAATLIAIEAGAKITDIDGHNFYFGEKIVRKNGVICASPALHALLLERATHSLYAHQSSAQQPKALKAKDLQTKDLETKMSDHTHNKENTQLLHIVIGGEMPDPNKTQFADLSAIDFVGAFPNYETAHSAWKSAAQRTVDNAHVRYFILHAHTLIDPDNDGYVG